MKTRKPSLAEQLEAALEDPRVKASMAEFQARKAAGLVNPSDLDDIEDPEGPEAQGRAANAALAKEIEELLRKPDSE